MNNSLLHITLTSREGVIFNADASSITSYNIKGRFDVLAEHANFISLIQKGATIIDAEGRVHEFNFTNALMKVYHNSVKVYVDLEAIQSMQN